MHSNKVIHRDLKLGNLFLGRHDDIKIGDFGLAVRPSMCDGRAHASEDSKSVAELA